MKKLKTVLAVLGVAGVLGALGAGLIRQGQAEGGASEHSLHAAQASRAAPEMGWSVGELRPDGLRIIPSGRTDGRAVLDPAQFSDAKVRQAYWIAAQIPEVPNQLYCWCGCENRGVHRSNLQCFEDRMGVDCQVCQGTAEIAHRMTREGITDAGRIQAEVDARWGPKT